MALRMRKEPHPNFSVSLPPLSSFRAFSVKLIIKADHPRGLCRIPHYFGGYDALSWLIAVAFEQQEDSGSCLLLFDSSSVTLQARGAPPAGGSCCGLLLTNGSRKMPNESAAEGHVESSSSSLEAASLKRQQARSPSSSRPSAEAPSPQQQQVGSASPSDREQQSHQPSSVPGEMMTCSTTPCAVATAGAALQAPFGSCAAERALGTQLHQLSFELKDQLHVDAKRTRTAFPCCSLCKAPQSSEGPCTASCEAASAVYPGAPEATQAPTEPSQSGDSVPLEGAAADGGGGEAVSATAQQKAGDDCCLTCSCPCHNTSSNTNTSIVCFEGPRRPPTFAANLADLCKAFPSVHQGLIISLLETAENDLQRAHALVRVVSDTNTGLHNPKTGGPMFKRKRCPDVDSECLGALADTSASSGVPSGELKAGTSAGLLRGSSGMDLGDGSPRSAYLPPEQQYQQAALQEQRAPAAAGAAAAAEPGTAARTQGGLSRLSLQMGGEQLSEAWCNEVAERLLWAIVTAASGDDAKAKAAALLREHAMQLAHAHHEALSQAELAKEAERERPQKNHLWSRQSRSTYKKIFFVKKLASATALIASEKGCFLLHRHTMVQVAFHAARLGLFSAGQELAKRVELLQNDKLLLARAVKAQHEKLQTLQHNLAAKTEEALHLMQELSGAQQHLRSLREAASALLLGAPSGRTSPCRDNSFDRRFPDVF
ncbi:hypothetical protein ACSSS7_002054 [Eimeria intestinalis]